MCFGNDRHLTEVTGSLTGRLQDGPSEWPERSKCEWIEEASGRKVAVFWPDGWDEQDSDAITGVVY